MINWLHERIALLRGTHILVYRIDIAPVAALRTPHASVRSSNYSTFSEPELFRRGGFRQHAINLIASGTFGFV